MQRRLSVEQHKIVVLQVPLDYPAVLQETACSLIVPQVYPVSSISDNILCSRILVRPVLYQLLQVDDVVRRHSFRICQISRYAVRHSDLVQVQVGISSDDGTSGEIHTLSHQVASETPFFALQTGSDRLHRTTGLLQRLWLTGQVIVHVRCYMVL